MKTLCAKVAGLWHRFKPKEEWERIDVKRKYIPKEKLEFVLDYGRMYVEI